MGLLMGSMLMMSRGGGALPILMDATRLIYSTDLSAGSITVQGRFYYDTDGGIRKMTESAGSQSTSDYGEWVTGHPISGAGNGYYIRVSFQSGTNVYSSGDGLGVWVELSTNRSWLFSDTVPAIQERVGTYLVEIASDAAGSNVLDSSVWTITLRNEGL